MNANNQSKTIGLGLVGAVIGGIIGYFAFFWIYHHGFYAMVMPGGLLGLGAGLCARGRSVPLAVICGIAALGLGLFTEWQFRPFTADRSLGYFVAHVSLLNTITLAMIGLGTVLGFFLALWTGQKSAGDPETR